MCSNSTNGAGNGPILAFLGPRGTYSHQAAYDRFAETVHYRARDTISDVFHSVGPTTQLALLPQENSIFGTVTETYDLLRSSAVGESKWIRGATLPEIQRVLSHEQALGQCQKFIETHLPTAQLVSVASTAAAAEAVSTLPDAANSAAICSKICVQLFADLEILYDGIQDKHERGECNALIRLELQRPASSMAPQASAVTVTDLLAALRLPGFIGQREQFDSVYFVEVLDDNEHGDSSQPSSRPSGRDGITGRSSSWMDRVLGAITRVAESGGRADLLGTW
ncbi:Prephenate dehydratase-domain-containing protein [Lactifluus volemus]|nr:Prephenate dehydratase-domain-containing protein [Lactifluus volemus]